MRFFSVPLSLILHLAAVAAFLAWGFWGRQPEAIYIPPVPVEIISKAELGDELSVPEMTKADEPVVEEPAAEEAPDPEPETVPEVVEADPEPVPPAPDPEAAPPLPEEDEAPVEDEPEVEVVEAEPPEPVKPEPVEEEDDLSDLAALIDRDPDKDDRQRPSVTNPDALGGERDQERIGTGDTLSITERSLIQSCVYSNYRPDKNALGWEQFFIQIRVKLQIDGSLAGAVEILNQGEINRSGNAAYQAATRNAVAAVNACVPFDQLDPARYDSWRSITLNFRPEDF